MSRLRAALRELVDIVVSAVIIVLALWTLGAAAGVVVIGFCMVARCG